MWVYVFYGKGVTLSPRPSIFRLAFISSMSRSLTTHPRIPAIHSWQFCRLPIGIQADGGQTDTLFYKLTHACGCMYFTERVSVRPPGLPFSLYIPIGVYLVRISYSLVYFSLLPSERGQGGVSFLFVCYPGILCRCILRLLFHTTYPSAISISGNTASPMGVGSPSGVGGSSNFIFFLGE